MDGKPHGGNTGVRPLDAMALVWREQKIIADSQFPWVRFTLDQQPSRACEHNDPFARGLVIPEPWRTCLPSRDDALDPQACAHRQLVNLLALQVRGESAEEISLHNAAPAKLYAGSGAPSRLRSTPLTFPVMGQTRGKGRQGWPYTDDGQDPENLSGNEGVGIA